MARTRSHGRSAGFAPARFAAAGVAVVLVAAVLAAAVPGSWRAADRSGGGGTLADVDGSAASGPLINLPPEVVVAAFWSAIGTALLTLVLLAVRHVRRRRTADHPPDAQAPAPLVAEIVVEPDLPVLRRGVDTAMTVLDAHPEPRDAVVAAWLALEEAAADAGLGRGPADTPTEFTATVLGAAMADRTPVELLLRLYHRARFSSAPLDAGDRGAARQALAGIAASWAGPAPVSPRVRTPDDEPTHGTTG